jgi:subtilisin family serine protease
VNLIGSSTLHSQGVRGNGIKIGIIDTGIEVTHSDFYGKNVIGWSNCGNGNFNDEIGHGTHVASIAAGSQGVAPQAQIYMYKVTCNDFSSGAIEALQRAINDGVQVVNMSFSVGIGPDDPLAVAIDSAVSQGVVVVAAAGNCTQSAGGCDDGTMYTQGIRNPLTGQKVIGSPAAARGAIAVGITDKNLQLARLIGLPGPTVWSAAGKTMTLAKPDLVAPAQEICAAGSQTVDAAYSAYGMNAISGKPGFFGWCDPQHAVLSGTSMSAPIVTGAVALLRQSHPDWNPDEIKSALRNKSATGVGNLSSYNYFDRGAGTLNVQSSASISGKPPIAKLLEVNYNYSKTTGLVISGAAIDRDTSASAKFKEYRIYYGKGRNPSAYALLKSSSTQVPSGVLAETLGATDCSGEIVFKLEVEDMNGNISRDYSLIQIN